MPPSPASVPALALHPILDDQVAGNKRRATTMVAIFVLTLALLVSLVGLAAGAGAVGVLVGLLLSGALAAAAWSKSETRVLSATAAQPADPVAHARLHNLVEGLCITAGLPKPGVHVIDDDAPNAYSAGRGPRQAAIVVTRGLTDKLNRIELEGVLAHELSHVKNHDILVSTLAVTLIGPLAKVLPATAVAGLVQRAVGRRRQPVADLTAVSFTRYPPGLIAALEKLRDHDTVVAYAPRATAHLWLAPAIAGDAARPFDIHPSLDQRIAALQEL